MPIIETVDLTHIYLPGTPYEKKALEGVSLSINKGELVGIIGANASGKSTLIQYFNGLFSTTAGRVLVFGQDTSVKSYRSKLWKRVGLLFQFPEQQLFNSTVFDELAYGLRNLGLSSKEVKSRVEKTLLILGLNPREISKMSPLSLSGGTRRLVALACILAMQPSILILDEPMVGLDPSGRKHFISVIREMQREYQSTVIMVSHYVDELLLLADKLIFLEEGKLLSSGSKQEVFHYLYLREIDELILPGHLSLIQWMKRNGYRINGDILTVDELASEIDRILKESSR